MEQTYEIKTNLDNYYLNYLTINRPVINSILSRINKKRVHIPDKPLKLLERLLYYNFRIAFANRNLTKKQRWALLMDLEMKKTICKEMKLADVKRVNTYLSRLRKLGVINEDGIVDEFEIFPSNRTIKYKITIHARPGDR
jgi:hypothetical protein